MRIDMNGVVYSLTYALDCIEAELVGVSEDHAKWVAYIATLIGKRLGYSKDELSDLSVCAALHDNALTQYLDEERIGDQQKSLGIHCSLGEKNVRDFPFHNDTHGFILYHHENANGTGPFNKTVSEIPMQAHIIHLVDTLDVNCHVKDISKENYQKIVTFLNKQRGVMFDSQLIDLFFDSITEDIYLDMKDQEINELLNKELPHCEDDYPFDQICHVMSIFGKIVDYKSPFTHNHSKQIAEKAYKMAEFYHYSNDTKERFYVAGALHDIGKMAITNDILEKPDKLTDVEFVQMKNHAWYTYLILSRIHGFEDITEWASLHHEKLNGQGYPFGKTAENLTQPDRLLACIDIYQALSEDRPYKEGLPHKKCIAIMKDMVKGGFIDGEITNHIDEVFSHI